MQRNRKSILNAISAVLLTVCNDLIGIISVKFILIFFGSDFNGLNSTASQLVNVLMIFEGGFTIATNVALFKPYIQKDYNKINSIITATRNTFKKIGILSFVAGVILSFGYSLIINTDLNRVLVFAIFLMTILPVCFNFYYTTKYRILLQAEQKEYVISLITLVTTSCGWIINIIAMSLGCSMWFIRFCLMIFSIINSIAIGAYVKRHFLFLDLKATPNYKAIQGTRDVFAQKITGVFYSTAPIICITITAGGTLLASVYAVYNSVFVLLKGILHAATDAPRLGIGELAAQEDRNRVWDVFQQYELAIVVLLFVFLVTASALIMPFIKVYTAGVTDINYEQPLIAVYLVSICFFELIHIPSGHLLNMTGHFKISKYFQIIACGIICIGFVITILLKLSIYGILSSMLITAISLSFMEIGYIHGKYFEKKIVSFLRLSIPYFVIAILVIVAEIKVLPIMDGYIKLCIWGALIFIINCLVAGIISFTINYKCSLKISQRILGLFLSRVKKH